MNSKVINEALEAASVAIRDLSTRNRDLMSRCSLYENTIRLVVQNTEDADAKSVLINLLERNAAKSDAEPAPGIFTEGE